MHVASFLLKSTVCDSIWSHWLPTLCSEKLLENSATMVETQTQTPASSSDPPPPPPNSEEPAAGRDEDEPVPDIQNPKLTSDDYDSDSDDEDEAQEDLLIQTLASELSNNPFNYDAHVQYIRALRKKGEIEKLRQAREAMYENFPLTPQMWQEWANDEASFASGPEAFAAIEKIYERGVLDYLSVPLWCDYINFVQEHDPSVCECSSDGISKARNLFERALTAAGLHVSEGGKIWEAYREFELIIFYAIDEIDTESREKQAQHVQNLFQRQLSIPLADLKPTLMSYKAWKADQGNELDINSSILEGVPPQVASAYQKALEMFDSRAHLEEQISRQDLPDAQRLQEFMTYLKFEQACGDPARVQILYERALTEFPISKDIWLDYSHFVDKTLKVSGIVKDVYYRATRNFPWLGDLWVRYLLSLERGRASDNEISAVFERSLQCSFSSFEEYLDVFLTRVDGLRRRISSGEESENVLNYAMIRDTFQRASDYLSPHLKNTNRLLQMHRYWAHLESSMGKDMVAARGVWESFLKISGSMLEAWQGYITMEVEMGCIKEARSLFKRCYSKRFSGTGSEDICDLWVRFEREFGMLEDFDHAVQKVTPRLLELQRFRQESKNVTASTDQENLVKKKDREKRKPISDLRDQQSPAKRQRDAAENHKMSGKDKAQNRHLVGVNEVEDTKINVSKYDNANGKEKKNLTHGKLSRYEDQCTAFISNLSFQATYRDLQSFFSDVGGVNAIRILTDKYTGKSRGLAYVDFSDEAYLAAAVAKSKQTLLGKKLSIARSDPKQGKRGGSNAHNSSGTGKTTGRADERTSAVGPSNSEGSAEGKENIERDRKYTEGSNRDGNVQLKGKNPLLPRSVRPLGWISTRPITEGTEQAGDEKPKSNEDFRKMFMKA